ncbi:hypothetical protein QFC21_001484 [Naganishia friedmannii]|uniref:Uncharacterized protein n=1 Tax=Naganishia friedmannii TaxID=89922 RepID=A0ACC2W4L7_9TREE|nr:hypothetical protein QFC21_001484 [Naganishia friedmannii]
MPRAYSVLAPALTPNALLDLSIPVASGSNSKKNLSEASVVRHYDLKPFTRDDDEQALLGHIKRIAVSQGPIGDEDEQVVALADDTHRISLTSLPTPLFEEPEDDARELAIKSQYQVKPARKSDRWIGLEILPNGILSSLSSGQINLHPFARTGTIRAASILSPLACVRTIPTNGSTGPTLMAVAGKDVEISLWDMERTFAAGPKVVQKNGATASGDGKTKKRKKDQLEEGEIWRAKHLPNNHLSLQTPIDYLSLCILPQTASESTHGSTLLAAGTKSGHIRKYDTRQRKHVADWKVAREGGIVTLEAGLNENELFFVDASSQFGSLDVRTGRTLYTYSKQTATAHDVLSLPSAGFAASGGKERVGMLSLSSDATVRLHTVSAPPKEAKGNVPRGEILGMIGGVGIGKMAYVGTTDIPSEENEDGREGSDEDAASGDDEDGEENVWNDLEVVRGDEDESEDDSESSEDEAEVLKVKRKKTDGKAAAPAFAPKKGQR